MSLEEALIAAEALWDMVEGEWPGPPSYAVSIWGCGTPKQVAAVKKLEAYLEIKNKQA